jgi:hypothetical protein
MLTGQDGACRTPVRGLSPGDKLPPWRYADGYWLTARGPWVKKHRRARGKAARREGKLLRRLNREGRGDLVLARLRSEVRRKLVTLQELRPR